MTDCILKLGEVMKRTGLSRSTIYAAIQQKTFPQQVPLGKHAVGWIEQEICSWIQDRISQRS